MIKLYGFASALSEIYKMAKSTWLVVETEAVMTVFGTTVILTVDLY